MPEGDTIARTAQSLSRWLQGRRITRAQSARAAVSPDRLVGQRVDAVEARGKHLLMRLSSGEVLHTHMRMTGSWHVYPAGERWRRPAHQARLVLEAGERVAVCFNAPVVELLTGREEADHPALSGLGPDVLGAYLDGADVRRRAARRDEDMPVAELLLDQRVVAGIGNIWRAEALFAERVNPWTPWPDAPLEPVVERAAALMSASNRVRPNVYRRAGKPCVRCGTPIRSEEIGTPARRIYWCPTCQPR